RPSFQGPDSSSAWRKFSGARHQSSHPAPYLSFSFRSDHEAAAPLFHFGTTQIYFKKKDENFGFKSIIYQKIRTFTYKEKNDNFKMFKNQHWRKLPNNCKPCQGH
ncbi:hypothetical protein ACFPIF_13375, partial [Brevundimonas faecalis]|uniref:hypothetical protein n=1 Tax=Brevundimonas faecalis TaxID=947378 RepID=UPI00361AC3DB